MKYIGKISEAIYDKFGDQFHWNVICDESNNSDDVIKSHKLRVDLTLEKDWQTKINTSFELSPHHIPLQSIDVTRF